MKRKGNIRKREQEKYVSVSKWVVGNGKYDNDDMMVVMIVFDTG